MEISGAAACGTYDELDPDDYDWADPDEQDVPVRLLLDDGTYIDPGEPLPPGQYVKSPVRVLEDDVEYDDDGNVANVHSFYAVRLIRRAIAIVASIVRRSVQRRPRERRASRRTATATRGSPARPRRSTPSLAPALFARGTS